MSFPNQTTFFKSSPVKRRGARPNRLWEPCGPLGIYSEYGHLLKTRGFRVLAPDATPEQAMPSASLKAQQAWKSAQEDAAQKLRDGASWLTSEQATGLLHRMVMNEPSHPDAGAERKSAQEEFLSAFRDRF